MGRLYRDIRIGAVHADNHKVLMVYGGICGFKDIRVRTFLGGMHTITNRMDVNLNIFWTFGFVSSLPFDGGISHWVADVLYFCSIWIKK